MFYIGCVRINFRLGTMELFVLLTLLLTRYVVDATSWSLSNLLLAGTKASLVFSESVAIGAQIGMEECQKQFVWDRWNCPRNAFTLFDKSDTQPANQEMAFVHAIISAAIMHTVTRNCSLGHYENCHCDNSKKGTIGASGWTWGGCSDNVRFGEQVSVGFLDTRERGHDVKALVNLHNNDIGRKVVRNTMKRICKCHGVSGSCATQTCWMRLADFSVIGDRLKQAYNKAKQIDYEYNRLNFGKERRNIDAGPLNFPQKHLVYMESSPEYCYANETAGSHGTEGRECSRSKGKHVPREERKSCKNLCRQCGLRVRKKVLHVESSCNCKFHWCCEVKCEVCRKKVTQFVCHR